MMVKHWNKLLREVGIAPSLLVFKLCLGNILKNVWSNF